MSRSSKAEAAMQDTMIITKQESLGQDKFTKNGVVKQLCYVVKNLPFCVYVSSASINFNQTPITVHLLYDFENKKDIKEVEMLKSDPLQYTAHVNDKGDQATLEVRICVLSSQHEGAYFRLKLNAKLANGKEVETYSQPIKVISKRNQVKKLLDKNEISPADPLPPSKRTSADTITDALSRLEEQQREQSKLIRQLMEQNQNTGTPQQSHQPIKSQIKIPDPDDIDFETAFQKFLNAYQRIPVEERQSKVRKVMKSSASVQAEVLGDFVNTYTAEILPPGMSTAEQNFMNAFMDLSTTELTNNGECCDNSLSCPHMYQLEKMDDIYAELFSDPLIEQQ